MVRVARRVSRSGFYHVMVRGDGKQDIFSSDGDRFRYLDIVRSVMADFPVRVIAWCLMGNHVHLLLNDAEGSLSSFMHRVNSAYAQHFNWIGHRIGHVYQDRFRSKPIESDAYLLQAVRYIHDNPVKSGICAAAEYLWSSFREYAGVSLPDSLRLADTALVLDMVGGTEGFVACSSREPEGYYHFSGGAAMSDEDAVDIASRIALKRFGTSFSLSLSNGLSPRERDELVRELRDVGLSVAQVCKLTGIAPATVKRACKRSEQQASDPVHAHSKP